MSSHQFLKKYGSGGRWNAGKPASKNIFNNEEKECTEVKV
jgi:hypothetical protein